MYGLRSLYYYNMSSGWLIMLLVSIALAMYSQIKVKSNFNKYLKVEASSRLTGKEVAERILKSHGLYDVQVEAVRGHLSDHFDPRSNTVRLSESVYGNRSIAAISVAAHEVGHAIQYAEGYGPMSIRSKLVPLVNIGSTMAWPMVFLGFLLSPVLIEVGIVLYLAVVLFQIVTLPVEINASSRALVELENGIITREEVSGSRKVLSAAALTYIAATLTAIVELFEIVIHSK